jgi:hypothetical protein
MIVMAEIAMPCPVSPSTNPVSRNAGCWKVAPGATASPETASRIAIQVCLVSRRVTPGEMTAASP